MAARPGLGHRPFRHERDRDVVQRGDLLGAVLVQGVMVGVGQRVGVRDVDLVLALAELALAELDGDAGAPHVVAHLPDEPLVLRGLQHVVVHDVARARPGIAVPAVGHLVERVLEQVELELGPGLDQVAHLGGGRDLGPKDRAWSDGGRLARLLVGDVADHHRGLLEPRAQPQRRDVGDHPEVAVPRVPARIGVAGQRLHLHVDREQVQARMQALGAEHLLEEEVGQDALAHEPALEVGELAEHRVDLAGVRQLGELLDGEHALRLHRPSSRQRRGPIRTAPPHDRSLTRARARPRSRPVPPQTLGPSGL